MFSNLFLEYVALFVLFIQNDEMSLIMGFTAITGVVGPINEMYYSVTIANSMKIAHDPTRDYHQLPIERDCDLSIPRLRSDLSSLNLRQKLFYFVWAIIFYFLLHVHFYFMPYLSVFFFTHAT